MACYRLTFLLCLAVITAPTIPSSTDTSPSTTTMVTSPPPTKTMTPPPATTTAVPIQASNSSSTLTTLETTSTSEQYSTSSETSTTSIEITSGTAPDSSGTASSDPNKLTTVSTNTTRENNSTPVTNTTREDNTTPVTNTTLENNTTPVTNTTLENNTAPVTSTTSEHSTVTSTTSELSSVLVTDTTVTEDKATSLSPLVSSSSTSSTSATGGESSTSTELGSTTGSSATSLSSTTFLEAVTTAHWTEPTSIAVPTEVPLLPGVKISETNFLLTDSDSDDYFVELQFEKVDKVWLVIRDANKPTKEDPLLEGSFILSESSNGIFTVIVNETTPGWSEMRNLESVLIAVYKDNSSAENLTSGLYDILLYSSYGKINPGLSERFLKIVNQNFTIDYKKLKGLPAVSLSRCSDDKVAANIAAVLTSRSPNKKNVCSLTFSDTLEMKLTSDRPCLFNAHDYNNALADYVISGVNSMEHCGLVFQMLSDMTVANKCNNGTKEIGVTFTVKSAVSDQLSLIVSGYQSFVTKPPLHTRIDGEDFNLNSCYVNCFPSSSPPTETSGDRLRVTIAVVVSCVGVFLVVLLLVILYLRRKRRGIHQFRMTRLDEDDDLIGDMDDFVGSHGPTFRSFR